MKNTGLKFRNALQLLLIVSLLSGLIGYAVLVFSNLTWRPKLGRAPNCFGIDASNDACPLPNLFNSLVVGNFELMLCHSHPALAG